MAVTTKLPNFIRFGRDVYGRLDEAERREWWLSNGRGAYAAGTISGSLTRRYHGLLLVPIDPPLGRRLVVAKADTTLISDRINALWYNALCIMAGFSRVLGRDAKQYKQLAQQARAGFQQFCRPHGGLFDVLEGPNGVDASIRPNQLLAISLAHSPLDDDTQARVLNECGDSLVCSYGLRSLAPTDPSYRATYQGAITQRDGAYHQGTVWAWLLVLYQHNIDGYSEMFDGDPPHTAIGAPAQAWSVACTLEAWWRIHRSDAARGNKNKVLVTE